MIFQSRQGLARLARRSDNNAQRAKNSSEQVHLFNQAIVASMDTTNGQVSLGKVDQNVSPLAFLGQMKPPQVHKLPFNFYNELPFLDMKSSRGMRGVG